MVKRIQFILGLCGLFLSLFDINATNESQTSHNNEITCSAPPPSNFRITTRGADFIDLAWEPAWLDAIHTITVSRNTGNGTENNWVPVDTFHNIPGSVFTINDVDCGPAYRIKIATNCSKDVVGTETDSLDEKTLIDLIISGRTPKNPVVVDCHNIGFMNPVNEWVGFRVSGNIEGAEVSNLFEFKVIQGRNLDNPFDVSIQIKRVNYSNPILAGNEEKEYPTNILPKIQSENPFYMYHQVDETSLELIGRIRIERHLGIISTVDICIDDFYAPWDYNNFSFEALVSDSAIDPPQFTHQVSNNLLTKNSAKRKIIIGNPILDQINLSCTNNPYGGIDHTNLTITNLQGETVFIDQINMSEKSVSIQVNHLPTGVYFIKLQDQFESNTFKVLIIK